MFKNKISKRFSCYFSILLSCILSTILFSFKAAAQVNDPLEPYLDGIAPPVSKELGSTDTAGVRLRKLLFASHKTINQQEIIIEQVFAAIAYPKDKGPFPGLLLLHGGGGSAELAKAVSWAKRGYVVLTLDLSGIANQGKVPFSTGAWKAYSYGSHRFVDDVTQSVIFDGVLAALRGLYLLRAQPQIDLHAIGVSGISWGGYMTTMVTGLAHEMIAASFSTYGSGFYDRGSTFCKLLDSLTDFGRRNWLTYQDAGRRAASIQSPFFIAAASNDHWFYPPAVTATLKAVKGASNHLFAPNRSYAAPVPGGTTEPDKAGWLKMEEVYFDYYLRRYGYALPKIVSVDQPLKSIRKNEKRTVCFRVEAWSPITEAHIYYSIGDTIWTARNWVDEPARLNSKGEYEAYLPASFWELGGWWYPSVSDGRPVTVSGYLHEALPVDLSSMTNNFTTMLFFNRYTIACNE